MKHFTEAELIEMERRAVKLFAYTKGRIDKLERQLNGSLSSEAEEKAVKALDAAESCLSVCEDIHALVARYRADHKTSK